MTENKPVTRVFASLRVHTDVETDVKQNAIINADARFAAVGNLAVLHQEVHVDEILVTDVGYPYPLKSVPGKVTHPEIVINVSGGVVQGVQIPAGSGIVVKVRDYDAAEEADVDSREDMPVDENGDQYAEVQWTA